MNTAPLFWITRPKADSEQLVHLLTRHKRSAVSSPVMRIEAVPCTLPAHAQHIIITSKHACHALVGTPRHMPVWCVGSALAALLHEQGFADVRVYPKASALLQDFSQKVKPPARTVYARGETIRLDITSLLKSQQYAAEDALCYRSIGLTELAPAVQTALQNKQPVTVLLYAMQAATFAKASLQHHGLSHATTHIRALCMSTTIAEEAKRCGFSPITTANKPDSAHMLESALAQHV